MCHVPWKRNPASTITDKTVHNKFNTSCKYIWNKFYFNSKYKTTFFASNIIKKSNSVYMTTDRIITHHYNIRSIKRYIKVPKLVHKNKKYVNYQAFKNKKSATKRIIYNPFALKIWIWKVQLAFNNVLLLKKVSACHVLQNKSGITF